MSDNIFDLLKEDHDKVAKMLETLADTTEAAVKKRQETFEKLVEALDLHKKFEEEVFYPQVKSRAENSGTKDLVDEAYEEHHVVDVLLDEMQDLAVDEEEWTAKLTVLKENIEHHVEEEEEQLFPKAKKVFTKEEVSEMGVQFKQWKGV